MPLYHRHFEPGHLQFITTSTYRRVALLADFTGAPLFVQALRAARSKFGFRLIGWVLMPEHFHLLFQPTEAQATSAIVQDVKQRSAAAILQTLRARSDLPACRLLLRALRLPPFFWPWVSSDRVKAHGERRRSPWLPLDILPEGWYPHLECLPKSNANASSYCKEPWTC